MNDFRCSYHQKLDSKVTVISGRCDACRTLGWHVLAQYNTVGRHLYQCTNVDCGHQTVPCSDGKCGNMAIAHPTYDERFCHACWKLQESAGDGDGDMREATMLCCWCCSKPRDGFRLVRHDRLVASLKSPRAVL